MLFVILKVISIVALPGVLLVVIGLIGLLFPWRRRWFRWAFISFSILGFAAIAVFPFGQWLLVPLEHRFPIPALPAQVDGIIVLGGAEEVEVTQEVGVPSFSGSMETVTTLMALARRYPNAALAFTGGSGMIGGADMSEADVVRQFYDEMGFTRLVKYEGKSRDTYENAVFLKNAVQPAPGSTWLLITTASHMPRSVGCFRAAGWLVIAWPRSFKTVTKLSDQFALIFSSGMGGRFGDLETAEHEWLGLIAYWLRGRTDALFPAP